MKKIIPLIFLFILLISPQLEAVFFDSHNGEVVEGYAFDKGLSDGVITSGLREALTISTQKAVDSLSVENGYFDNPAVKIRVPEKVRTIAEDLRKIGFYKTVDEFERSMNRAVEMAAPMATPIFISSIKEMAFDDARKILNGGDFAATEYFRKKASHRLYETFKPMVSETLNQVKAAKKYKKMIENYAALIPFPETQIIDLDRYVAEKGIDGFFLMMAEEEKKIRTDPVARTTNLLKQVFGQS